MNIYFGYIEGISRIDTPYFATLGEQEDYFDSHEVVTIDTTFYPPHYLNKIKVDTDEISFNVNVNYLWFEYNSKRYYYFIDDVEYISESVIYIYITMDTIQTYMFDIRITNGVIERKFINRWNGSNINRNYIRENVSNNNFGRVTTNVVNNDRMKWMYILKCNNFLSANQTLGHPVSDVGVREETSLYPIPYALYFSYASGQYYNSNFIGNDVSSRAPMIPAAAEIYVIPFEAIYNVSLDSSYNISGLVLSKQNYTVDNGTAQLFYNSTFIYESLLNKVDYTYPYVKNTNPYALFSVDYMPMLLDNNYCKLTFGDSAYRTDFPLHMANSVNFHMYYWADLGSGTRYYNIVNGSRDYNFNAYGTIVKNPAVLSFDLKNNAWEEYISRNRYSVVNALISDAGNAAKVGIDMYASDVGYNNKLTNIARNDEYWDKRYKTPHLKKRAVPIVNNLVANREEEQIRNTGSFIGKGNNMMDYVTNRDNLKATPNSVKQTGIANNDFMGNVAYIRSNISKVNDYDVCGYYFHKNGYLINEYVNNITNIFTYVNTRYHFNVLKMSDVDLHLSNVIEDDSTVNSITNRLFDGLRLWNKVYKPYIKHINNITGASQSWSYDIPFEGVYVTNTLQLISSQGGNAHMTLTVNAHSITVSILVNSPGLFEVSGDIYSYDSTTRNINIGDFTFDNVEKDYL